MRFTAIDYTYTDMLKLKFTFAVFLAALFISFYIMTVGWNHNLSDIHGFRQSFTATAIYYFIKGGFRLDYLVPVLGAPWSIPIEFPLYQVIVATLSKTLSLPIIQTGRFITLAFFYSTLVLVFYSLKELKVNLSDRLIILSLILVNPLYLFWSRTVSIESTALFFSIGFLLFFIKFLHQKQQRFFFLTTIFGTLAALTKGFTFVPALIISVIYLLISLVNSVKKTGIFQTVKIYIWTLIPLVISLSLGFIWTIYSDHIKSLNPFGVTVPLSSGYFSYWGIRFSSQVWERLFDLTNSLVLGSAFSILIIIFGLIFSRKYKGLILSLSFSYFLTLFLFANLYFVHDYYFYASAIYLIMALGFGLISIGQRFSNPLTKYLLPIVLIVTLLMVYQQKYFPYQNSESTALEEIGSTIKKLTNPEDVILVYFQDWSPEIPFYGERKAIIDYRRLPLSSETIQKSIKNTGKENIKAMFVMTPYLADLNFLTERMKMFGFNNLPIFQNSAGAVFMKL